MVTGKTIIRLFTPSYLVMRFLVLKDKNFNKIFILQKKDEEKNLPSNYRKRI